jgi:hypothetical protein
LASQRLLISPAKEFKPCARFSKKQLLQGLKTDISHDVDSTLATAEVSKAKIALNLAKEFRERTKQ